LDDGKYKATSGKFVPGFEPMTRKEI